jgi:hypothetical protein
MVATRMAGKRKFPNARPDGRPGDLWLGNGEYGKDRNGTWWLRMPNSGSLISLLDLAHPVKEESGGRISVGGTLEEETREPGGLKVRKWQLVSGEWREVGGR